MGKFFNKITLSTVVAIAIVGVGLKLRWFTGEYALAQAISVDGSFSIFPNQAQMAARQKLATENLQKCIAECRPEEARIAERMLAITNAMTDKKEKFEDHIPEMVSLYSDMIDLYEKAQDVNSLVSSYSAALGLIPTLKTFGELDPSFIAKVNGGVEQLPTKYPNNAKVYGLLAFYLTLNEPQTEPVIEAYKHCLVLDANNQSCRKGYDTWVQIYTHSRCIGSDLNAHNFGLYLASTRKSGGLAKIESNDGQVYYIESRPKIDSRDVADIYPTMDEYGQNQMNIHLTNDGKKRFAEFTRGNAGKILAIVLDDKVLSAPTIKGEINSDTMQVSSGLGKKDAKPLFEQICDKPTSPALPERLKL